MGVYRKIVTKGRELEGDLLRQRRDVYVTSLALIIFQIAGGNLKPEGVLAAVHIQFAHPHRLYYIAIAALVYFVYRYWVVAPDWFERYKEEAYNQSRVLDDWIEASRGYLKPRIPEDKWSEAENYLRQRYSMEFRYTPDHGYSPQSHSLRHPTDFSAIRASFPSSRNPPKSSDPSAEEQRKLMRARRIGFLRAIVLERTVTDLFLPYVVAGIALAWSIAAVIW